MPKFTITATAPNGATRVRKTDLLYTWATARGGEIVGFHIDRGTAERAAKRRSGTVIVPTVLDAKALDAIVQERRTAANKSLAKRGLEIGALAKVRLKGGKDIVAEILDVVPGEEINGRLMSMPVVTVRDIATGAEHERELMFVQNTQ